MLTSRRPQRLAVAVLAASTLLLALPSAAAAAKSAAELDSMLDTEFLVDSRVGELQLTYDARISELQQSLHQLQLQHDQLRQFVEAALPRSSSSSAGGATTNKPLPGRHLADTPDVSTDFSGISIKRDDSFVALGVDSDTMLVRTGPGELAVVAGTATFHGAVCVDGGNGCLTVYDDELLFNGESISAGSGLDGFVNKSLVGRQCATVDTSSVADGCVRLYHASRRHYYHARQPKLLELACPQTLSPRPTDSFSSCLNIAQCTRQVLPLASSLCDCRCSPAAARRYLGGGTFVGNAAVSHGQ